MYKQIISVAALVASALALPTINDAPKNIQAGQSYSITWSPSTTATGPISLLLKTGPNENLATVATIATGLTGTSYTWVVPSTYANGGYAIEIVQGTESNYWGGVTYSGGSGTAASAAAGSGAASMPAASGVMSAAPVASGSAMTTAARNSTMTTSHTSSKTSGTSTGTKSSTTATATIVSTNSAITLGSPVALILGAFAAMFYLQ